MELNNDLVTVVALYATERVIYQLFGLSQDLSSSLYTRTAFWRVKVEFETRGVMVDPEVVAGRWANYYRLVNRTYYGRVRMVKTARLVEFFGYLQTGDRLVWVADFAETARAHPLQDLDLPPARVAKALKGDLAAVCQTDDGAIRVFYTDGKVEMIPYGRPIVDIIAGATNARFVGLDERGVAFELNIVSGKTRKLRDDVVGIADLVPGGIDMLTRDRNIIYYQGKPIAKTDGMGWVEDPVVLIVPNSLSDVMGRSYIVDYEDSSVVYLAQRPERQFATPSTTFDFLTYPTPDQRTEPSAGIGSGTLRVTVGVAPVVLNRFGELAIYTPLLTIKPYRPISAPPVQTLSVTDKIVLITDG